MSIEHLPMLPQKMQLVEIKETSKQYNVIENLLRRPDISDVMIATDSGCAGELVARWIMMKTSIRATA